MRRSSSKKHSTHDEKGAFGYSPLGYSVDNKKWQWFYSSVHFDGTYWSNPITLESNDDQVIRLGNEESFASSPLDSPSSGSTFQIRIDVSGGKVVGAALVKGDKKKTLNIIPRTHIAPIPHKSNPHETLFSSVDRKNAAVTDYRNNRENYLKSAMPDLDINNIDNMGLDRNVLLCHGENGSVELTLLADNDGAKATTSQYASVDEIPDGTWVDLVLFFSCPKKTRKKTLAALKPTNPYLIACEI